MNQTSTSHMCEKRQVTYHLKKELAIQDWFHTITFAKSNGTQCYRGYRLALILYHFHLKILSNFKRRCYSGLNENGLHRLIGSGTILEHVTLLE